MHLVDLETGDALGSVQVSYRPGIVSGDGCTMGFPDVPDEPTTVIGPSVGTELRTNQARMAADGSAVIIRDEDQSLEIVDLGNPDAAPVVIDAVSADFVTRRPDGRSPGEHPRCAAPCGQVARADLADNGVTSRRWEMNGATRAPHGHMTVVLTDQEEAR